MPQTMELLLQELRRQFAEQLPAKLDQIEATYRQFRQENRSGKDVHELYRFVHSLTGSGATFGMPLLSDAARDLECHLRAQSEADRPASSSEWELARTGIETLREVARNYLATLEPLLNTPAPAATPIEISQPEPAVPRRTVLLLDADSLFADTLASQLGFYGYSLQRVKTVKDLLVHLQSQPLPLAIILDVMLPRDHEAGFDIATGLPADIREQVPLVFVSRNGDFKTRLDAVRAGGRAFFSKPVEIPRLADLLESFAGLSDCVPYRVLVIEDSPTLAELYAATLRDAGMEVRAMTDPLQLQEVLAQFSPELILLDMYMPYCSGDELAGVIRQQDYYVGVPIVFLSAESDVARQLQAMSWGGDDFLTKPIELRNLVQSVKNRVARYRVLRDLMEHDSLTNLLNHTKSKEHLDIELARATRNQTPLTVAMLDIDHFKNVNDSYGHPVGDRVIKSLVLLLRQRLRKTDIIGRYGGEEFLVVMGATDANTACAVLNSIREDFSRIQHDSDKGEFHVTFSAGVAECSGLRTATELTRAADEALYAAKHAGRNRIMVGGQ